jgi:hypothetical protein
MAGASWPPACLCQGAFVVQGPGLEQIQPGLTEALGREWQPTGAPERVRVHDFPGDAIGKAIPYGVYDMARNEAWVSVGRDHDTPAFAVASIRQWVPAERLRALSGLHPEDVNRLMAQLDGLVEAGNTVIVVEHDMRVGGVQRLRHRHRPGPGEESGRIVAAGTPREVAAAAASRTAPFLRRRRLNAEAGPDSGPTAAPVTPSVDRSSGGLPSEAAVLREIPFARLGERRPPDPPGFHGPRRDSGGSR